MLNKMRISLVIILLLCLYSGLYASRMPDTLRFGDIVYTHHKEQLYVDEAKFVIINESSEYGYVMASLFKDHIRFFDNDGNTIKIDSLPGEPRFYYSKTGRWLFLWCDYDEEKNYYCLYGPSGEKLFERVSPPKTYESAFGVPLEKSLRFVKPGYPEAKLSLFDKSGTPIGGVSPLGPNTLGNIFFAGDLEEQYIFTAVSLDTASVLIRYNTNLVEQKRTVIPGLRTTALRTSANGKFVLLRVVDSQKAQPMIIMNQDGEGLFAIELPRIVKFSSDESLLAFSSGPGRVTIVETGEWKPVMIPDIEADVQWNDINFSGDSKYLIAFDGDKIVFVDIQSKAWFVASFPFAFFQATLINNTDNLVFTGDFGWVVYQRVK